tara:strand:+ start:170 stop:679 length:510 start_codon:yes stop_codon:yes gene_type:complete
MKIINLIKILLISFLISNPVYSAGSSSDSSSGVSMPKANTPFYSATTRIKKAKKLEAKGKLEKSKKLYTEALEFLYKANKENPLEPDILNYLGFANRKVGNTADAETYYLMGLEIDPKHNGINEYLGELYVNTNRINLANERLNVLKGCNCKEYKQLKDIIEGKKTSKY